ncbi:hypothetical protein ES703_119453 [subsurface metagenome]
MPEIGEVKRGSELGYKSIYNKYIYQPCIDCGKGRWVVAWRVGTDKRCNRCAGLGANNSCWRGGRITNYDGYIEVKLQPEDFFYSMATKQGYILEHRLVVAKALGRNLHSWEIVHHKHDKYPANSLEDKQDNRYPENLQLVSDLGHKQITILENEIYHLNQRVTLLEAEIILLRETQVSLLYEHTGLLG